MNHGNTYSQKSTRGQALYLLTPLLGSFLFLLCYLVAALYYPGGSQADANSAGFSWSQNYWCHLLAENALNGADNTGRPFALASMAVLLVSLTSFWFIFSIKMGLKRNHRITIQAAGTLSMITILALSSQYHDAIIHAASVLGLIALMGIYKALYQFRWNKLLAMGVASLLLIALNYYLYYHDELIFYLPVVQKITFLIFLLWMCLLDLKIYKAATKGQAPIPGD